MASYATIQDVTNLFRPLTADEQTKVGYLLPIVSDVLRDEARKVGRDLDEMISEGELSANTVKAVTVDVISRVLRQNTTDEPMTQESQSALGYTWSGTYTIPGGGIANALLKNDLKRLGLRKQKIGVIDLAQTKGDFGITV